MAQLTFGNAFINNWTMYGLSSNGGRVDLGLNGQPCQGELIFCNSFGSPPNHHVGQSSSTLNYSAGGSGQKHEGPIT